MRVLLVNTLYREQDFGGAEISVDLLARGLRSRNHDVAVLSICSDPDSVIVYDDHIKHYRFRYRNLYWQHDGTKHSILSKLLWHYRDDSLDSFYSLARAVIEDFRPDVVHTNVLAGISSAVWDAAMVGGVCTVHTLRDYYSICVRSTRYKRGRECKQSCSDCKILSRHRRRLLGQISAVVAISNKVLSIHRDQVELPRACHVIPNASYRSLPLVDLDAKLQGRGSNLRIGILGRISAEKGVVEFVHAFIGSSPVNVELFVGGTGSVESMESLRSAAVLCPHVHVLGQVSSEVFFQSIDVLVVPSRWSEPFGRIIPEAFAHGVPCIVRNMGGMPEQIWHSNNGYIFESDEDAIQMIEQLAANPPLLSALSKGALDSSSFYSVERMTDSYLAVYEAAINESHSGSGKA